eukprot:6212686-Pleurochrysis_carterae.AAC.5
MGDPYWDSQVNMIQLRTYTSLCRPLQLCYRLASSFGTMQWTYCVNTTITTIYTSIQSGLDVRTLPTRISLSPPPLLPPSFVVAALSSSASPVASVMTAASAGVCVERTDWT